MQLTLFNTFAFSYNLPLKAQTPYVLPLIQPLGRGISTPNLLQI